MYPNYNNYYPQQTQVTQQQPIYQMPVYRQGVTATQCRARFRIHFGANIAIPTGGTVEAISLAIALDGEAIPSTIMTITPAAVENYFNVSASIFVDIPKGCCSHVSIQNISTQPVLVQNANLIAERSA